MIEDNVYSGREVNGGLKDFREKVLYFRNVIAVEVQERLTGYRVEREDIGNRSCVDGTLMHLAQLDA